MAEWRFIYQAVALVVLFYITYQAYLVSRIKVDGSDSDFAAAHGQYAQQLEARLVKLEAQQAVFVEKMVQSQDTLDRIEHVKREQQHVVEMEATKTAEYNKPIPVLMIACNRVTVARALDSVLAARAKYDSRLFPITVSQDCGHEATLDVIRHYSKSNPDLNYIEQLDRSEPWQVKRNFLGYYKLSRHYKFALSKVFELFPNADGVIIIEDDLEVSPDFLTFFKSLAPLLLDPAENLYCLSAWNDNGKEGQIEPNPSLLHRTDFFGGLGWMMKKTVWLDEWANEWPEAFWDDWVRHQDRRRGRSCIRPEISRTSTFGKVGVSNGQFFDMHLAKIHENTQDITWSADEIGSLRRITYDETFLARVEQMKTLKVPLKVPLTKAINEFGQNEKTRDVRVIYTGKKHFEQLAKQLQIMSDFKAGVPRCGYYGVVQTQIGDNIRVFLTPDDPRHWQYQTQW